MRTRSIVSTDITDTDNTLLLADGPTATSATTANTTTTTTTPDLGSMLSAAVAGGYVAHSSERTYTVSSPIVIQVNSTIQGPLGIDLGGATIISQITNGAPVIEIEIDVGPGVDLRYLTLCNFTIQGNGAEGDGIKIVADGNDRWVYNWNISNVTVNHVGGYGLDIQGSVFEGLVSNSWMNGNTQGGAYFSHSANGGQASALHWFGGGFENNGGAGLTLDNGARDMSVDGATITNNTGAGISASQGITSVTDSTIADNHGPGVWFQNYGNFNYNTFSDPSGTQTVGITGYLAGDATFVGDTSTDGATLASLDGYGGAFEALNTGTIVNGPGVTASGVGGGNLAHVSLGSQGVNLPALAPITAATTAPLPTSNGTSALEAGLKAAMAGNYVAHLTDPSYTITAPIVINVTSTNQGAFGIDLGGAKILSQISDGGPVIEIIVGPGVNLSRLTLSNFGIQGNGSEGDGIKIVIDGADRTIADLSINNISVEHVGGIGLDVLGHVSHGLVFNSWMNGNAQGGARFANSPAGGIASGLEWEAGGFRLNGVAGMILDNGTHDMIVKGAYFVQNQGPGIDATSGISLVQASGFENNTGAGAIVQGSGNFTDNTFSTYGPQTTGVGGYLTGDKITLTGSSNEYYGPGSDPTVLANVQGSGTLAIAGAGNVLVDPRIGVTGGDPVIDLTTPPVVTEHLLNDTGLSSTDLITSDPSVAGTSDPNATVHFTIDGTAISDTATADANGTWSFTLTGLADGAHTVVGSETNAQGRTGSASLAFTLDTGTSVPVFTGGMMANGQITVTGTGEAGATLSIYDGYTWMGFVTVGSDGKFTFTGSGDTTVSHSFGAIATDLAGNEAKSTTPYVVSPPAAPPTVTEKLVSDTGSSSTDKITSSAALSGTADPNSIVHFTLDGTSVAATTTADDLGIWSFTPTGLADGLHTIVASETNAAGLTGSASLSFTLDTTVPVPSFADASQANGKATLTGTSEAGSTLSIYDGNTWMGFATTGSDGTWSFTAKAAASMVHSYGALATDVAGNEGRTAGVAILGSSSRDTLTGTAAGDVIVGNGGNDTIAGRAGDDTLRGGAGADRLIGGAGADSLSGNAGSDTFVYNTTSDSNPAAADTIADFVHGSDKIDFSNIAGINATNGVPLFQGNITGTGNLTLNAHSVAFLEVGDNTVVLANASSGAETVTTTDTHAADMEIVLLSIHLGLAAGDFLYA